MDPIERDQASTHPLTGSFTRRRVLVAGAGVTGLAALAACGGDDTSGGGGTPGGGTSGGGAGGGVLAEVGDVPVGGAVSAKDADGKPVIVAQPEEGTFVGFSAICTHKGCTVAPKGAGLACPCHGSTFDAATGDNTGGPAPEPLAKFAVSVKDGKVLRA